MRIILLAILLTGCVTYPTAVKRFECNAEEKKRLHRVVTPCLESMFLNAPYRDDEVAEKCHAIALRTVCRPKAFYRWEVFPFGVESSDIPCEQAYSWAERWVCDE